MIKFSTMSLTLSLRGIFLITKCALGSVISHSGNMPWMSRFVVEHFGAGYTQAPKKLSNNVNKCSCQKKIGERDAICIDLNIYVFVRTIALLARRGHCNELHLKQEEKMEPHVKPFAHAPWAIN